MHFDNLTFESHGGLARVTLNRPHKLNALDLGLVDELRAAARAIGEDAGVRAVLMTGAGRAFCAGADLNDEALFGGARASLGEAIGASLKDHFNPMVIEWCELKVPVVVAVNGVAAGAGVSLALMGDLVIAAHSASFLQLFAPKLGLMPDLGSTYFMPRLIGMARAKGMSLLGDAVSAADAARWGLIWECVEDETLLERAEAMARRLATGPTQAYQRIKSALEDGAASGLARQLEREAALQSELGDTADFAAALRAFRTKAPPTFEGH